MKFKTQQDVASRSHVSLGDHNVDVDDRLRGETWDRRAHVLDPDDRDAGGAQRARVFGAQRFNSSGQLGS